MKSTLLIDGVDLEWDSFHRVEEAGHSAGLRVLRGSGLQEGLRDLRQMIASGEEPAAVLISPTLQNPLHAARQVRRLAPLVQMVLLTRSPTDESALHRSISPTSLIGSYWTTLNLEGGDISSSLREAALSTGQRQHLRTTIDRVNLQLASPPPADSSDYRKLVLSDRYLANILENARDAIIAIDNRGAVTTWNRGAERLFGQAELNAIGRPIETIASGDWPEVLPGLLRSARERSPIPMQEISCRRADGSEFEVELVLAPVYDGRNRSIGVSAIAREITERKRTEAERLELEARVQHAQKLESLGVLAGGIAHDFNNLLTGILGYVELSLLELSAEEPVRQNLEQMKKTAIRAAGLCNQMLAYSGKGKFVVKSFDLGSLVTEMTDLLEVSISKDAQVLYDFAPDLPPVEGDVNQIRQVVMNLITNASDAIGPGQGEIQVRTGVIDAGDSYLAECAVGAECPKGSYVYVEVADTGCGMDEETVGKIFDPYFTTKATGRGLGLAAVLGIIRSHEGAMHIRTSPGHGTRMRVMLPLCLEPAESIAADPPSDDDWRGSGTVLVVDDEETVRIVASRMLRHRGFEVMTANGGLEAVDLLRSHTDRIVAVLLDMTMPHMDGEATFRELRLIRRDIPVVLTSGCTELDVNKHFRSDELAGFVQKPFRELDLMRRFREILRDR